ncbi:MAG: helix-turn-helix domain-containing protein [Caldisericia bacterium]|jgi:excisionase family DNA binding protein|nr:helix-turn-helix domain-containing protein [Candidatus Nanoarchaeia archaeon]MDD4613791.1 helix-turn-helix domain-containing protein [Caldisericia bacterium]
MTEHQQTQALTPKQVAEELNVTATTVHVLLRDGDLKGFKIKRQWRIAREELDAFKTRGRRE